MLIGSWGARFIPVTLFSKRFGGLVGGLILSACAQDPLLVSGTIPDKKTAPIVIASVDVDFATEDDGIASFRQEQDLLEAVAAALNTALLRPVTSEGLAIPSTLEIRITDAAQVEPGAESGLQRVVGGYQNLDSTVRILNQQTGDVIAVYQVEEEANNPSYLWPAFIEQSPTQRAAKNLAEKVRQIVY